MEARSGIDNAQVSHSGGKGQSTHLYNLDGIIGNASLGVELGCPRIKARRQPPREEAN